MAGMLQALTAAGVDPTTWMTDLKVVGEDSIDGTPTYHLSGTIDMNKIMTDVIKLMQDKTIQGMLPSMGSGMMGTTGSSITMPSQEELQGIESQLGAMFKNLTLDMWVTKDTYQLRQVELNASIVPPAGEDAQGINSIRHQGHGLHGSGDHAADRHPAGRCEAVQRAREVPWSAAGSLLRSSGWSNESVTQPTNGPPDRRRHGCRDEDDGPVCRSRQAGLRFALGV